MQEFLTVFLCALLGGALFGLPGVLLGGALAWAVFEIVRDL